MHANTVCDYHPHKDYPYNTIISIGGDNLPYPSDLGSTDATLMEAKIIFNRVISTPGYQFICADINDYLLCSPIKCFKYIKISFLWIPE